MKETETTIDLLATRYKCTGNGEYHYPNSPNKVGDIVEPIRGWLVYVGYAVDNYPHLFRKLEWWEERKPEEMPECLRHNETGEILKAYKWWNYELTGLFFKTDEDEDFNRWVDDYTPATEAEYLEYQNSQK